MDNHSLYLEKEKTWKLLIKFAVPCVLSLLVSALYNIVDQIFIGNSDVGTIGNTATTIIFPLTCLILAISLCLGDGCAAFMSLCYGKKEFERPVKAVGSAITFGTIISLLSVALCLPLMDKLVVVFGASTELAIEKSVEYGRIIVCGFPMFLFVAMVGGIIRADGNPKGAMISMISGSLANVVLDAVFIFVFKWGLTGAALATIIGQFISFIFSIIYLCKTRTFKLKFKDFLIDWGCIAEVIKLGISSFLTQISIVIVSIVSMNMLAKYGKVSKYGADDPQAIVGVSMKVFSIAVNIAIGIAVGGQPIIGYNYGAKRYDRVKETYKYIILSVGVVGIIATILFQTIPGAIIGIFGTNSSNPANYKEFGEMTIRIYLSLIFFTLLQKASSIFLQSIGSPVKSTILSMSRDLISFVPLVILLPYLFDDITGILYASPIADIIGTIIGVVFVVIEIKKMNAKIKEQKELETVEMN